MAIGHVVDNLCASCGMQHGNWQFQRVRIRQDISDVTEKVKANPLWIIDQNLKNMVANWLRFHHLNESKNHNIVIARRGFGRP